MKKLETNLNDCYILEPNRFGDERGYFESLTNEQLEELGFNGVYQVSNSLSGKGIVRGLHYQKDPYCQAKVVRCQRGAVLDVVVDIRKDSSTYGKYTSVLLTSENGRMLYVPRGFAHGFVSLKDDTLFEYYVDNAYSPKNEGGILWNDEDLHIPWDEIFNEYGIEEAVLSSKDKDRKPLKDIDDSFLRRKKRYLVTGFSGQLGYDIVRELNKRGEYDILALDSKMMDITNRDEVLKIVSSYQPDYIFHCAAWTKVDLAEVEQEKCALVNYIGTKNITDASIMVDAKLVYVSTDYVFDGLKDGVYYETDKINPQSVYGKTKAMGEEEARRNPKHFIARTSWVFGINGNNFVKTMINLADNHKELKVVCDQFGSPTYTVDLAKKLVEMVHTDKYGTYHINNEGYCSWAEFASYIMSTNNLDTKIIPVTTAQYYEGKDMSKIAYRPYNSRLSKSKLEENGFDLLPDWMDAVDRYSRELKQCKTLIRRK